MALQRQIGSTLVTVLLFPKTEIEDRAGILIPVRVLKVMISKNYRYLWHSFFKYIFGSSYIFYPIGITVGEKVLSVCLEPVSTAT